MDGIGRLGHDPPCGPSADWALIDYMGDKNAKRFTAFHTNLHSSKESMQNDSFTETRKSPFAIRAKALTIMLNELSRHYRLLRTMLRFEFFYAEQDEPECFSRVLQYCRGPDAGPTPGPGPGRGHGWARDVLSWAAWGTLYSLRAAAITLTEQISCEHSVGVKLIQRHVARAASSPSPQGSSSSSPIPPYCLSLEVAANCLRGLAAVGALATTKTAQAFPMDGIGRLGHDPPRGPGAGWWVLTTADAAGTNGLTCLPKHGGARDSKFSVTHPMTDHCESCLNATIAAEKTPTY
ncbi:hypothetical protein evm_013784 [Chilo suppressalis]|nr:hypothetical protein evm_013784 [Chilo suppressalis]